MAQSVKDWATDSPAATDYVLIVKSTLGVGDEKRVLFTAFGDMFASVYDPGAVAANAFSMLNMVEGVDARILTDAERAAIAANDIGDFLADGSVPMTGTFQLGTNNVTGMRAVSIVDGSGNEVGVMGELSGELAFGNTQDTGAGAIIVGISEARLYGTSIQIPDFADATAPINRTLGITSGGWLYTIDPLPPAQEDSDTDNSSYDLGTGTGIGSWVNMTGLAISGFVVASGEHFRSTAIIQANNKTTNRSGVIELGFSINGADPTTGQLFPIPPDLDSSLVVHLTTSSLDLVPGDTISVSGRRISGSNAAFGVDLDGTTNVHELEGYKPSVGLSEASAATYDVEDDANGRIVHCSHSPTAAQTVTIKTALISAGFQGLVIKDGGMNAGVNAITIATEGSETIDGASTYVIDEDGGAVTLYALDGNVFVI